MKKGIAICKKQSKTKQNRGPEVAYISF